MRTTEFTVTHSELLNSLSHLLSLEICSIVPCSQRWPPKERRIIKVISFRFNFLKFFVSYMENCSKGRAKRCQVERSILKLFFWYCYLERCLKQVLKSCWKETVEGWKDLYCSALAPWSAGLIHMHISLCDL